MLDTFEEPVIREKGDNKKMLYFILILFLIGAVLFWLIQDESGMVKEDMDTMTTSGQERILSVEGVLLEVDPATSELSVILSARREGLSRDENIEGDTRIVKISPDTVVQKLILERDGTNSIIRSGDIEVNVTDLNKSDRLHIEYVGLRKDEVIDEVKTISVMIETDRFEEKYEEELSKISKEPFLGIKGKVIEVDENQSKLTYNPYSLNELTLSTSTAVLKDDNSIYVVKNESRLNIDHAKEQVTWSQIEVGDDLFIVLEPGFDLTEANKKNVRAESLLVVKRD